MRTKTESLARKNWKSLSLRSSSDMAVKQAVLAVKVADRAQVDREAAEKVVLVADGVVLVEQVVEEVVLAVLMLLAVLAATDLEDLILTDNNKPSVCSRRRGNAPEFHSGVAYHISRTDGVDHKSG